MKKKITSLLLLTFITILLIAGSTFAIMDDEKKLLTQSVNVSEKEIQTHLKSIHN